MRDQRDSVGPLATIGLCICMLVTLFGAFVGGLINGAITPAVVLASLSAVAALAAVVALLRRAGILVIRVQPPVWLDRFEQRSRADPRPSEGVNAAVALATDEARHFRHAQVGTEHLLLGLMRQRGHAARALESCGVTLETLIRAVDLIAGTGADDLQETPTLAPSARRTLLEAADRAREGRARIVTTAHLLLALAASPNQTAGAVLEHLGCTRPVLANTLRATRGRGDD
jgi:hypothetical protein